MHQFRVNYGYSHDLDRRDDQLRALHQQLFLAKQRRDKHVIREIEQQIYRCGSSCGPIRLHTIGRGSKKRK